MIDDLNKAINSISGIMGIALLNKNILDSTRNENKYFKELKGGYKCKKMVESQSRYSIVERLTQSKMDIITAQANLDSEVKKAKQTAESLKEDLKDLESNAKADLYRRKREMQKQIKSAEREARNAEDKKKSKENAYKEKIKTIDEALKRIEEISKTTPTTSGK